MLRMETRSLEFETDKEISPICRIPEQQGTSYCDGSLNGPGAAYDAGSYDVSVNIEYQLNINVNAEARNATFSSLPFETGNQAVLAVDYNKSGKITLREVNPDTDRGLLSDDDLPASRAVWLTINGSDIARSVLTCAINGQQLCRKTRAYTSGKVGGFVHPVGEWGEAPTQTFHIIYSDLRSQTFVYSVLTGQKAEYFLSTFNGLSKTYPLGSIADISAIGVAAGNYSSLLSSSPFGAQANFFNTNNEEFYRDQETNNLLQASKINPILGQYTPEPAVNGVLEVAPLLTDFEVAVAGDQSVLVSGRLPDGQVFNIHTGITSVVAPTLAEFLGVDLSNSTVLPIGVH